MHTDRRTDWFTLCLVEVSTDLQSMKTCCFQMLLTLNFMNQTATVMHSEMHNATPLILNCLTLFWGIDLHKPLSLAYVQEYHISISPLYELLIVLNNKHPNYLISILFIYNLFMLASFYSMLFLNMCRRPITDIKKSTE
jgi:hypothetical protein